LKEARHPRLRAFIERHDPEEALMNPLSALDPSRFERLVVQGDARFLLDRLGQVAVLNAKQDVVFMFVAHGDSWSAWLPDGTRYGIGPIHSWPNPPDALVRMGQALLAAVGGVR
jgi:hypothetical protein